MMTKLTQFAGMAFLLLMVGNNANAKNYQDVTLGGVNLTAWCQKTHGSAFKAKLIEKHAGGWTCEQSLGNRRPISVRSACQLQYGRKAYKARAVNWNNPYSWKCFARKVVPTMKGVNLTPWCKRTYGSAFKAKLIQNTPT